MLYDVLQDLEKHDGLKVLIRNGCIPPSVVIKKQAFEFFQSEKAKGLGTSQAVTNTAIFFNVSERWVYDALKQMKRPV